MLESDPIRYEEFSVDTKSLAALCAGDLSAEVRGAAEVFRENFGLAVGCAAIPRILIGHTMIVTGADNVPDPEYTGADGVTALLAELCRSEPGAKHLRRLLLLCTTDVWTSFEVLSGDLWEATVNAHPDLATASGIKASGQDVKNFDVGTLRKYDFDLRKRMGTLLMQRFSFKSVASIAKAYVAIFGNQEPWLKVFLDNQDLVSRLEAARHVIVHRAGRIDQAYILATGGRANEIGMPLPMDAPGFCLHARAVTIMGGALISAADSWIKAHPISAPRKHSLAEIFGLMSERPEGVPDE